MTNLALTVVYIGIYVMIWLAWLLTDREPSE